MDESKPHQDNHDICKNCSGTLLPEDKYCSHCGQKRTSGLITLQELFADFFESVLNLDARIFRTLPLLFVPGLLTVRFFEGKHLRYFKPVRLFFTSMIILFAVFGFKFLGNLEQEVDSGNSIEEFVNARGVLEATDSARIAINYSGLPPSQKAAIDSFAKRVEAPFLGPARQTISFDLNDTTLVVDLQEVIEMSTDSFLDKHGITALQDRLLTRQSIRFRKNPKKVVGFAVGNTTWMIILLMPAVAFILKFLYIRRNKYYVEHLVFLYHYHATLFIIGTIYILLYDLIPPASASLISGGMLIFLFLAMKRFYRQGYFKTTLKFFSLLFAYTFTLIIYVLITGLLSFLFFR